MNFQRTKIALALGMGGVALAAGGAADAQDIRVNVTGTNIKRVDTETAGRLEDTILTRARQIRIAQTADSR